MERERKREKEREKRKGSVNATKNRQVSGLLLWGL
jgi:hypothetical protein